MSGSDLVSLYDRLVEEQDGFEGFWRFGRWYVLPERPGCVRDRPVEAVQDSLVNTTAVEAADKLAGAHMSMVVPSHQEWMKLEAGCVDESAFSAFDREELDAWYGACSEVMLKELLRSNFYTELHECVRDRVSLGTGSLFSSVNDEGGLFFAHVACGDFAAGLDDEGRVGVYVRVMRVCAVEAERLWGRKGSLTKKMRDALDKGKGAEWKQDFVVLHVVQRRKGGVGGARRDGWAWESFYVARDEKEVICKGGFNEMPYLVTRFLKFGRSAYGLPCWVKVKGAIVSAQKMDYSLDVGVEAAVFPRLLQVASQVGTVNLRAGGKTVVSQEAADSGFPKVWAPVGDLSSGMARLQDKERKINSAFFVPMIDLFASVDKRSMTATEVVARENNEVRNFSPTYFLFAGDVSPMLLRVFALLYRSGKFPKAPRSAFAGTGVVDEDGFPLDGDGVRSEVLVDPNPVLQGKIALVLNRQKADAFFDAASQLMAFEQVAPGVSDVLDMDGGFRDWCRAGGVKESRIRSQKDVDARREKRAEGERMAQEVALLKELTGAAKGAAEVDAINGGGGGVE